MKRMLLLLVLLLHMFGAAACAPQRGARDDLRGTLLVWHTWSGPAGELMLAFFDSFMEINPEVMIVSEYVEEDRLVSRFLDQTEAGLGPDLLIGLRPAVVADLAAKARLSDLNDASLDLADLNQEAVDALRMGEQLFGLPVATHTQVLFYNKRLANSAPTGLNDLITAAQEEQISALPVDFYHSYWGVHGFSGRLILQEDRVDVAGGVEEWLAWLQAAQKEPKIILSENQDELYEIFAAGQAAYLIGDSALLPDLRARLGEEQVGVAYLPANDLAIPPQEEDGSPDLQGLYRTVVPPGSFLELEVATLSQVSAQQPLGLALLKFLTNAVQQREIATSDLGYAPVNQRVRFDHRLSPAEMTLVRQSANAPIVPLHVVEAFTRLQRAADDGYAQVLGGVLEAGEGAERIRTLLNEGE
jgi:arabinogalactan oligomer/maltooligosaccharide transport system substrate-binding protein